MELGWIAVGCVVVFFLCLGLVYLGLKDDLKKKKEEDNKRKIVELSIREKLVNALLDSMADNQGSKDLLSSSQKEEELIKILRKKTCEHLDSFYNENGITNRKLLLIKAKEDVAVGGFCGVSDTCFFYNIGRGDGGSKFKEEIFKKLLRLANSNDKSIFSLTSMFGDAHSFVTTRIPCDVIPLEDIKYYKLEGNRSYTNKVNVSGGGVNATGAVAGAMIYGAAGAIIGSKAGTDIRTTNETVEHDDRRLIFVYKKNGVINNCSYYGADVDEVQAVFNELIPQKNFDYIAATHGETSSTNTFSADSRSIVSDKGIDYSGLRQLKGLLDEGIITEEEFNAKKAQVLGLN